MFHEFERKTDIADYDRAGLMRIDSILNIFQEAAIGHSASVGYPTETYMGIGNIWMHNKNLFKVDKLPDFKQKLVVRTWSRGIDKFRGYRNYEIIADGEKCITGSSIWIYLNIAKRRPVRPTEDMLKRYDSEDLPVLDDRIKTLKVDEPADEYEKIVTVRPSDFDVNGHVSNVVYGAFIDVALQDAGVDIVNKYVSFSYMHEITPDIQEVIVRMSKTEQGHQLGIYSGDVCHCTCGVDNE